MVVSFVTICCDDNESEIKDCFVQFIYTSRFNGSVFRAAVNEANLFSLIGRFLGRWLAFDDVVFPSKA